MTYPAQLNPKKRQLHTPQGLIDVEIRDPQPNVSFPKGPCPIIQGPCVQDAERCGFWIEMLGVEVGLLGVHKNIITGSCLFFATMNMTMNPRIVQAPNHVPPNQSGQKNMG
jgi:hypothetical protein